MMKQFSTLDAQRDDSRAEFMPRLADTDRANPVDSLTTSTGSLTFWKKWYGAFKQIFPIYLAVHLAFLVVTCLSFIYTTQDFNTNQVPLQTLWQVWHRWDTGHYMTIATPGYIDAWRTAFFPLFPLLERGLMFVTHYALIAGLIISVVA